MVEDDAIGMALGRALQQLLAGAQRHLGWRGGRVHEGVHEARKALRRARALLRLEQSALGADVAAIDRELAAIGRSLSPLRDAMARVETLDRLLALGKDDAVLLRRCRRVAAATRATLARERLAADPGLSVLRQRLADAAAAVRDLPWASIRTLDIAVALQQAQASAHQAKRRAQRDGGDDDWHRWRRRERMLLQSRALLRDAGMALDPDPESLLRLAAALGRAQDLAVLRRDCAAGKVTSRVDRKALARILSRRLTRARKAITHLLAVTQVEGA